MTDTEPSAVVDPKDPAYRRRVLVENALGRILAEADHFIPLSLRSRVAQAAVDALADAREPDGKPPVPTVTGPGWPRIPLDENDPDYRQIVRIATFAADLWALGPDRQPAMTRADVTRGQIAEALAMLLEMGVIDMDRERLALWMRAGLPMNRPRAAAP